MTVKAIMPERFMNPVAPLAHKATDTHSHHDQALIARLLLDRGHAVAGDLSKVFRRTQHG